MPLNALPSSSPSTAQRRNGRFGWGGLSSTRFVRSACRGPLSDRHQGDCQRGKAPNGRHRTLCQCQRGQRSVIGATASMAQGSMAVIHPLATLAQGSTTDAGTSRAGKRVPGPTWRRLPHGHPARCPAFFSLPAWHTAPRTSLPRLPAFARAWGQAVGIHPSRQIRNLLASLNLLEITNPDDGIAQKQIRPHTV